MVNKINCMWNFKCCCKSLVVFCIVRSISLNIVLKQYLLSVVFQYFNSKNKFGGKVEQIIIKTQKIINVIVIQPPICFQHLKRVKNSIFKNLFKCWFFWWIWMTLQPKTPFFLNLRKFGTVALKKKKNNKIHVIKI